MTELKKQYNHLQIFDKDDRMMNNILIWEWPKTDSIGNLN
jgi:hypothetical protein